MIDAYKTGTLIKNSRQKLHLSQQELADKLHISRATVSKWETGKGMPDISLLLPLADCLNLSSSAMLRFRQSAAGRLPEPQHCRTAERRNC